MTLPNQVNQLLMRQASTAYSVYNSLRFRSSASAYLSRTPASAGNQQKWTWSSWVKRGQITSSGYLELFSTGTVANNYATIQFGLDNIQLYNDVAGTPTLFLNTTAVYRDPSAWYHIVVAIDTTQATAANRALIYVNGVQATSFSTATYPSQNANLLFNASGQVHAIGAGYNGSYRDYFDGYLAEVNFIDGQALTPSSFGAYNSIGVWQPARYTGTYGTNGFYLKFASFGTAAALGTDSSGNGNTWTVNNISVTAGTTYDPMLDSPTLTSATVANYAVWNPINSNGGTFSNANLQFIGASAWKWALSTFQIPSNVNVYAEATLIGTPLSNTDAQVYAAFGIVPFNWQTTNPTTNPLAAGGLWINDTGFVHNNNATGTNTGSAFALNDVIGLAFNPSTGAYTFYKNGASISSGTFSLTGPFCFANSSYSSANGQMAVNFGQRPFSYTPPTGFVALNAYNLPTPTIANGATVMAATTYTGNGSTQSVLNSNNTTTAVSFQPDLVWIKDRTAARANWVLDVLRGVYNILSTNATSAESTVSTTLTAFNSNGFSVGSNADFNTNAEAYIGWQWKAGGTGVSNTNGSITSTVSVNATAGFSVVTFTTQSTGTATVGHGLNAVPSLIITKARAVASDWVTYHVSLGNTGYIYLSTTGAFVTNSTIWNNTTPTSTVITLGSGFAGAYSQVFYCWSAVAGYSAFGSYTGNGSSDGPFIYCGFRPRFVMVKRTDSTGDWQMYDTSQNTYNVCLNTLAANSANGNSSYVSGYDLDIISNGFKWRAAGVVANASGGAYIYAAFAENPFKYALAR